MVAAVPIAVIGGITGDFRLGAAVAFYLIAAGFATMAIAIMTIALPEMRRATGQTVLHDIADGLAFVARHRIFLLLLMMSFAHRLLRTVVPVAAARIRGGRAGARAGGTRPAADGERRGRAHRHLPLGILRSAAEQGADARRRRGAARRFRAGVRPQRGHGSGTGSRWPWRL